MMDQNNSKTFENNETVHAAVFTLLVRGYYSLRFVFA